MCMYRTCTWIYVYIDRYFANGVCFFVIWPIACCSLSVRPVAVCTGWPLPMIIKTCNWVRITYSWNCTYVCCLLFGCCRFVHILFVFITDGNKYSFSAGAHAWAMNLHSFMQKSNEKKRNSTAHVDGFKRNLLQSFVCFAFACDVHKYGMRA